MLAGKSILNTYYRNAVFFNRQYISNFAMFIFLYYVIIFAVQSLFALRQSERDVWCQLHFDEVCCSIDQAAVALETAPESKPLPSPPYISQCTKL